MRSASNGGEKAGSATSDRGRTANRAAYRNGRRVSRAVGVATPVLRAIRSGVVIILLAAVVPAAVAESPWRTGVALTYDGAGNVLSIGPDRYAYDLASRIASATTRGVTRTYAYDAYGNRTDCVQGAQPCGATMLGYGLDSSTNRLTHGTDVRYDPRGNLTAFGGHEYTYDVLDAQTSDKWATGDRKYLYDADGERIGTLEDGQWTWTIRDTNGKVVREFTSTAVDGDWSWSRDYVWREGVLLASIQDGVPGRHHYHLDHLGTPREVTNSLGLTVGVHSFHPFGVELGDGVNEPSRAPLQFTGHERDTADLNPNAHLDYMHARYYSPTVGRFLSVDPVMDVKTNLTNPQDWNRYAYVRNNPMRWTDPTGKVIEYDDDFRKRVSTDKVFRAAFEAWKKTASGKAQWQAMGRDKDTKYIFSVGKVTYQPSLLSGKFAVNGMTLPPAYNARENKYGQLNNAWTKSTINADRMQEAGTPRTQARTIAGALFEEAAHALDLGSSSRTEWGANMAEQGFHADPPTEPRWVRYMRELLTVLPPED